MLTPTTKINKVNKMNKISDKQAAADEAAHDSECVMVDLLILRKAQSDLQYVMYTDTDKLTAPMQTAINAALDELIRINEV